MRMHIASNFEFPTNEGCELRESFSCISYLLILHDRSYCPSQTGATPPPAPPCDWFWRSMSVSTFDSSAHAEEAQSLLLRMYGIVCTTIYSSRPGSTSMYRRLRATRGRYITLVYIRASCIIIPVKRLRTQSGRRGPQPASRPRFPRDYAGLRPILRYYRVISAGAKAWLRCITGLFTV